MLSGKYQFYFQQWTGMWSKYQNLVFLTGVLGLVSVLLIDSMSFTRVHVFTTTDMVSKLSFLFVSTPSINEVRQ